MLLDGCRLGNSFQQRSKVWMLQTAETWTHKQGIRGLYCSPRLIQAQKQAVASSVGEQQARDVSHSAWMTSSAVRC